MHTINEAADSSFYREQMHVAAHFKPPLNKVCSFKVAY